MYVTFPVSQREFLRAQESGTPGRRHRHQGAHPLLPTARVYDQMGTINFVDVTVDRATDTVLVRATMPNPKGALIDGQLVRVDLESGTPEEKVVVPQAALIADQEGVYVFVVEDGKAAMQARQARRRERHRTSSIEQGLERRRAGHRRGAAGRAPRRAGAGDAAAADAQPEAEPMLSAIFVDRPRLAIVIAIVTTIAGLLALYVDSDRAISRYRAAAGLGHDHLSGRQFRAWSTRPSPSRSRRRSSASTR